MTSTSRTMKHRRLRTTATVVLVVFSSITLVAATIGVWFHRTIWDTESYVSIIAPLADDPAVTQAVANDLTAEAFVALDVPGRVAAALDAIPALPDAARFLAGPISAGAETAIGRQVQRFLDSDAFEDLWIGIHRTSHEKVTALLDGDYEELPNVNIDGGEVRINLISALAQVMRSVAQGGVDGLGFDVTIPEIPPGLDASAAITRLESALNVDLPDDFGQVAIMTQDELTGYQDAARALNRLGLALALVTAVLVGLAVLIAPDRRRAIIWAGLGGTIGIILATIALRRVRFSIVDSIDTAGARAVADNVFTQIGGSLRHAGIVVGVVSLLVAVLAYVAGRPPWIERRVVSARASMVRTDGIAPFERSISSHAALARMAIAAVAVLILWLTGIGWLSVLIVGAMTAIALWQVTAAEARVGGSSAAPLDGPGSSAAEPLPVADA
jgi:hypothetical protein